MGNYVKPSWTLEPMQAALICHVVAVKAVSFFCVLGGDPSGYFPNLSRFVFVNRSQGFSVRNFCWESLWSKSRRLIHLTL